jgi:subtilisin family serine protease
MVENSMQSTSTLRKVLTMSIGLGAGVAQASTVAVIDSGLDTLQPDLENRIWTNSGDTADDGVDQDGNGYVDDVHGWNFAERNNVLLDRSFKDLYDSDVERFFEIQAATLLGTATSADREWVNAKIGDTAFAKRLMTYGNYAHGTHVSGIVAGQDERVEVIGIKLLPTKNPLQSLHSDVQRDVQEGKSLNWILKQTIKGGLILFAKLQAQAFKPIGGYTRISQADVVNGSFGIGATQARMLLTPVIKLAMRGREPSKQVVDELARFFLRQLVNEQQILMRQAPDTLFVFAAGNEGSNNDDMPAAPAGIQHPHVISVAASYADGRLAPFSNYGQSVDLAAPGVAITSPVPDNLRLKLSGTSQASPHVAGTAAAIKAINPELMATDLKAIIVKTVDVLPELKDKVKSSGVLNHRRAVEAARLSLTMPLSQAIAEANSTVRSSLDKSFVAARGDGKLLIDVMPSLLGN